MELNTSILIKLIKEEISNLVTEETTQEAAEDLYGYLSRLMGKLNFNDPGQLDTVYQQAKQKLEMQQTAGNRRDVNEMCGDMQSIDMEQPTHHEEDHEGNMAKRQMFKTAQYAAEIFDNIQDGEEFPAWIQSKMTKIADYIGVVKHYLEYDHVMGEKLDKDATAGDYVKDFQKSDAPQFKGKSKKKKQKMAIAAYLDAQEDK